MEINKDYRKQIEQIKISGEDYANEAMKDVYMEQKEALDMMHSYIGKLYVDNSVDGLLVLSTAQKNKITTDMKSKLRAMGLKLGKSEVEQVTTILTSLFATSYYKNAFVMESGMKANLKFNILKKEFIDSAVNAKYKGEFFSDRIWTNKASMIDKLQSHIISAMKGDMTIDKVGKSIKETFNCTAYESRRLVSTEVSRVQAQASYDIGKSTGVEQVMFLAVLDGRTCAEDANLDGKIYSIDDPSKPDLPSHPNCRCNFCNIPYQNWNPTQRRDNETGKNIDYTNYADWAKSKGI